MQNTINFNLNKPEGTDIYNIQNENDNMDIIDAALAKAYFTDDSASTELANADYLPFYDTSASEKKKMLLSTARNDVRARIAESVSNDVMETIGGTALNSYSVGQYFLGNDGYYYVTTSAITAYSSHISTGVSGNCSKTSIAAGMNNLISQISNLGTHYYSHKYVNKLEDSISVTVPAGKYLVIFSVKSQSSEKWIYAKIDNAGSSNMDYFGVRTPVNGSANILDYSRTLVKEYNSQHTIELSCSTDWYSICLIAVRIH